MDRTQKLKELRTKLYDLRLKIEQAVEGSAEKKELSAEANKLHGEIAHLLLASKEAARKGEASSKDSQIRI